MILAQQNDRIIPVEDKIFQLNGRAKKMIKEVGADKVINGTIGALLSDDGTLAVMKSVVESIRKLEDNDFAEYAPIGGIPSFKKAIEKAAFGDYRPKGYVETVATPGGTGGIRNVIANYSCCGDSIITSDWYWAPYKTLCKEQGRELITYKLFDEQGKFNFKSFVSIVEKVAKEQRRVTILLNTPAHNPTGYSLEDKEWDKIIEILNCENFKGIPISLFIDVAYIDFAGDPHEVRKFMPKLERLNENVLPIIGYSASKTFTAYGMRTGAMICIAKSKEIAQEFKSVCEFSARNTWSNCNRSGQQVVANIYEDSETLMAVEQERKIFRDILLERGKVFEEKSREVGLDIVPFDAGFFTCISCDNSEEVSENLARKGLFVVPLTKGIRISIASISKEQCVKAVEIISSVLK